MDKQVDILIIGGGLTGATLMLALRGLGYSTLLLESKPLATRITPHFDARSLALSPATQRILTMLGVWEHIREHSTAIEKIHVSDQNYFGMSRLQGDASNPLGYVVEMQYMNQALYQALNKDQIIAPALLKSLDLENQSATVTTESGEVTIGAQLVVAADGAESMVRQLCHLPADIKNYHQQALVANVGLAKSHHNCAYERFTAHGPLALLPLQGNRVSLVWSLPSEQAQQMMLISDADFLKELQRTFGYRLGRLVKIGERSTYPLKQVIMPRQTKWPVVFIGNAAHSLHPVAGQGFNLGLRDVATLAQCISQHGLNAEMLDDYLKSRSHDQRVITRMTDGLIDLFTSRLPGAGFLRTLGLIAFDNIPALKNVLARYARGFGGVIPDLVCEIALEQKE